MRTDRDAADDFEREATGAAQTMPETNVAEEERKAPTPPAATRCSWPEHPLSASLHELVAGLRIGEEATRDVLCAAGAWCAAQGLDSVGELLEVGAADELVQALPLKPGKARLLSKRLAAAAATPLSVPVGEPVLPVGVHLAHDLAPACVCSPVGRGRNAPCEPHERAQGLDWAALARAYTEAEMRLEAQCT